ncbi:MAG: O-antigen ligase family protein [Deltaproteobacteria bacterium]|nr:MAG: O-antigen ligase family protein [Deltaproteobacteria bacterium]
MPFALRLPAVSIESLIKCAGFTQRFAFAALLILTPLARGATPRWIFCIAVWLALLAFVAMILKRVWRGERLLPRSPLDPVVALLVLLTLGSLLTSIYPSATVWAAIRLLLYVAVFYLTFDLARSRTQTKGLVVAILGVGTALAFIGFIKYHQGTLPSFWNYGTPGEETFLTSTFMNHNHIAGYLAMVFTLCLGVFLYRPFGNLAIWGALLVLILVALCLSMSRGSWIATFVALEFMLISYVYKSQLRRFRLWSMGLALLLVVFITILASNPVIERLHSVQNIEETSLKARLAVWKKSLDVVLMRPIWGSGLGTFPWSFSQVRPAGLTHRYREAHNDYVQVITEMGLPVLVPLSWGIFLIFRTGLRGLRQTRSRFRLAINLGALGGIIAILVHSLSDFNIQITANGILFGVLIGLVVGSSDGRSNAQMLGGQPQTLAVR